MVGILETKQEEKQRCARSHRCAQEEHAVPISIVHAIQCKRTSRPATADWESGGVADVELTFTRRDNEFVSLGTVVVGTIRDMWS